MAGDSYLTAIRSAYEEVFGSPDRPLPFTSGKGKLKRADVLVYYPEEAIRSDPEIYATNFFTAGFGAVEICEDRSCELTMKAMGELDAPSMDAIARALVDLAAVPLRTGRLFREGEILTNLSLPHFPRFDRATLLDWDVSYGFRFPDPCTAIGLLRVIPLFASEADFLESSTSLQDGYLDLYASGLNPGDPDRVPVR